VTGLPALLGALGLIGILFGLLNYMLALFGAGLDVVWIGGNLVAGLALLGTAVALNLESLRERLSSGEAKRAGKYGTSAVLTALLGLALIGMGAFLANRYSVRFDWSEDQVHSLSDQTRKLLGGLDDEVSVLALYPALDVAPVRALLDRYAYESPSFVVEYADPNERPDLIERFQIPEADLERGLVRVALGAEATLVKEPTEENITNAMVKLTRSGSKKVYFLDGHNERSVDGEDAAGADGFGRAADALRNENYAVEPLLLAARGDVPDDADVVVVAGATRPLLSEEHDALGRYLSGGGSLMVLIDPRANTDLVEPLRSWGVDVGDDVIVDRQLALFGRATTPFAGRYDPEHPITREMRDTTLFHVARSIRSAAGASASGGNDTDDPVTGGTTNGSGEFTELVFTSDDSWAERDLENFYAEGRAELSGDDLAGPVSVGVAGRPGVVRTPPSELLEAGESADGAEPKLVVFGDADFASNELIEAYRNRDLFLNSVNWLLGDIEAISIRPRQSRASRFELSAAQFTTIRSLSIFVLPEAIAVAGVVVWWRRRHGAGVASS
jgi:ABC-type uncharacterized transport system involved in gliding motility auxiliary subunit